MKRNFTTIAASAAFTAMVLATANPVMAGEYRIAYFGARDCPPCMEWKAADLPAWRSRETAARVPIVMNEERRLYAIDDRSFGSMNNVYRAAKRRRGYFGAPMFVLLDNDEIVRVGFGLRGWKKIIGFLGES